MPQHFSDETQQLLDRAQRAINNAIELRAARLRAVEERRRRFWNLAPVLSRSDAPDPLEGA
jgi:hypothetical protein